MLRLIVMRHGEAEPDVGPSDHDRRLLPRGRLDAKAVGQELAAAGWLPQLGYVSDAPRALETRSCVAESLASTAWKETGKLYLAPRQAVIDELRPADSAVTTLMVIGHNPGLSDLVSALTDEPLRLDTAEAVLLIVDADSWSEAFAMLGLWSVARHVRAH